MKIISAITELRTDLAPWRQAGQTIALVPTMGNLHAGHINLVKTAFTMADQVVVSIFVNPLQFVAGEDYQTYPRTLEADCEKLRTVSTDLLFTPSVTEIYPTGMAASTSIEVPHLSNLLCGASRPGHFIGVATVVNKLFNIVQPQLALFGEKDYQQLLIIQRMVADLYLPIEIIGVPTYRADDGLALSSRNSYLNPQQRRIAPRLFQILDQMRRQIIAGYQDLTQLESQAIANLTDAGFQPDYVSVRNALTLVIPTVADQDLIILAAAWLGKARLIDNIKVCSKSLGGC
jgi:pantoate--beta-alanine ligase